MCTSIIVRNGFCLLTLLLFSAHCGKHAMAEQSPDLYAIDHTLVTGNEFSCLAAGYGNWWGNVIVEFRQNGEFVHAAFALAEAESEKPEYTRIVYRTPKNLKKGYYSVRLLIWSPGYGPSNSKQVRVVLNAFEQKASPGNSLFPAADGWKRKIVPGLSGRPVDNGIGPWGPIGPGPVIRESAGFGRVVSPSAPNALRRTNILRGRGGLGFGNAMAPTQPGLRGRR